MKAEYINEISEDGEFPLPEDIRTRLKRGKKIKVTLETMEEGDASSTDSPGTFSYSRQSVSQEDRRMVSDILRSDWLTGGPKVREFEEALAAYCGAKHCVATANGTAALHVAAMALDLGPGDTALTSPLTFMASSNCILYCGGRPDFADIDPETLCLSPERVEEYCSKKGAPKAVIPVSFAGVPADLPSFRDLAEKYGFKLVEDAAHALGSSYTFEGKNYLCGSCAHTDLAILSFHPVKNITTGEGGAVLTNDDGLATKLRMRVNHGIERNSGKWLGFPEKPLESFEAYYGPWYHEMQVLGYNYRITDFQCALGLSQLERLETFKSRRQALAGTYNRRLESLVESGLLRLPPWPEQTDPCFHLYVLQFEKGADIRYKVYMELRKYGIFTQVHYIPVHMQPYYRKHFGFQWGDFPHAESYYEKALSMPLYPVLRDKDVEYIVDILKGLLQDL